MDQQQIQEAFSMMKASWEEQLPYIYEGVLDFADEVEEEFPGIESSMGFVLTQYVAGITVHLLNQLFDGEFQTCKVEYLRYFEIMAEKIQENGNS